jgi:hypothetical protein
VLYELPLLGRVRGLQADDPGCAVAVLIPELVKRKWWQFLLHTHRARRLRAKLLRFGEGRVVVINVPWALDAPHQTGERKI